MFILSLLGVKASGGFLLGARFSEAGSNYSSDLVSTKVVLASWFTADFVTTD